MNGFVRSLSLLGLAVGLPLASLPSPAAAQAPRRVTVEDVGRLLPKCWGGFTQADIDEIGTTADDPRESFERHRVGRLSMVEISPYQDCRSQIWRLQRGRLATAAAPSWLEEIEGAPRKAANLGANAPAAGGVEDYQGETTIAVHPTNPNRLVAGANTAYRDSAPACIAPAGAAKSYGTQALYGSTDGGKTWTYTCAPWHPQVTGGVASAVAYFGSDPAVAWDAAGNAYAVYMLVSQNAAGQSTSAMVVAKSTDSGASWAPHGVIVNTITDKQSFQDKELLAIDTTSGGTYSHPGRMYVIWDESKLTASGGLISQIERVAYSDDGVTWTIVPLGGVGFQVGGQVVVGIDGTVYAAWNRVYPPNSLGQAAGDDTYWSRSTDGGQTWAAPAKIIDHTMASFQYYYGPAMQNERIPNSFVSFDVNRNSQSPWYGRLHLAWTDVTPTCCPTSNYSPLDIYSIYSSSGGTSWSNRVKVNDDSAATHLFPWLSVDASDGTVSVVWYDSRGDAGNDGNAQVFTARSSNGGVSFEANLQVTDNGAKFPNAIDSCNENTFTNPDANPNQYGDYLGVAAANRKIVAFWADSRTYFPLKPAGDDRVEDATAAIVTHCSAPSWFSLGFPIPPPSATTPPAGSPISVSWTAVTSSGINGNGATYTVHRYANASCLGKISTVVVSNTSLLAITDTPPASGTYSYHIVPRNKCPGTALTPMTGTASACSNAVNYVKP